MSTFAATYDLRDGPLISISVALPGAIASRDGQWRQCTALIDSGASMSAISHQLIAVLRLPLIGREPVAFANTMESVDTHLADIRVPLTGEGGDELGLECQGAHVFRISPARSHQAILGRDLLASVVFTLDGPQRRFTLSLPRDA